MNNNLFDLIVDRGLISQNTFNYNNWYDKNVRIRISDYNYYSFEDYQLSTGQDSNSIFVNPLFRDPNF